MKHDARSSDQPKTASQLYKPVGIRAVAAAHAVKPAKSSRNPRDGERRVCLASAGFDSPSAD